MDLSKYNLKSINVAKKIHQTNTRDILFRKTYNKKAISSKISVK